MKYIWGQREKLDDLGIAYNTIVIYSTDNRAETASWPYGGITPFHGEKETIWKGGFRVLCVVRWPGMIKPGKKIQEIMSHEDWIPTLMAAAGVSDIGAKLKKGHSANGKTWKVHLEGCDFTSYFQGRTDNGRREEIFYFSQGGELNAIRWQDWKVHFAKLEGKIATGVRTIPGWPVIINLKADPYEVMRKESTMYICWYADNMRLFVPIQAKIKRFLGSLEGYPFQQGSSLNAAGINYNTLKTLKVLKKLDKAGYISR